MRSTTVAELQASVEEKIVQSYSDEYCAELEAAYGIGMMSEGGSEAIDALMNGVDLKNKRILDYGSGLGGVAYYIAKKHQAKVTGLEINPWMVDWASKQNRLNLDVDFVLKPEGAKLPFESETFDVVYSKGVFTHVPEKASLFREIHRVLKPSGTLVICDWLGQEDGKWGPLLSEMAEMEGLMLFALSEKSYLDLLSQEGFVDITAEDEGARYARYNHQIAQRLLDQDSEGSFIQRFGSKKLQDSVKGYRLIAQAIETSELRVMQFICHKR